MRIVSLANAMSLVEADGILEIVAEGIKRGKEVG